MVLSLVILVPVVLALAGVGALPEPRALALLGRSLALAGAVCLTATALGGLLGLATAATDLPGRSGYWLAGLLPLALPPAVAGVAWLDLTQQLARRGWSPSGWLLTGLAQVLAFAPLAALALWVGVRQLDPSLEEAARLTRTPGRAWLRVSLPLLAPYWGLGALLVLLASLNDTALPSLLQVHVYAVEVSASLGTFLDARQAAALSGPPGLLLALGAGLWLAFWSRGRRGQARWQPPGQRWRLGAARAPVAVTLSLLTALAAGLPLLWLLLGAADPASWRLALELGGADFLRTILESAVLALFTVALGFGLALAVPERPVQALFLGLSLLGLALPPALLVEVWHRFTGDGPLLALGVFGARYLVFPLGLAQARRAQVDPALADAARLQPPRARKRLWLGYYGRAALAAGALVFMLSACDLSTHLLADPPGWGSLTVRIFSLAHYGRLDAVAALCLAEVVMLAAPLPWLARER